MAHADNVANWTALGYDPLDTSLFLATIKKTLDSPNSLLDLRLPAGEEYRAAMSDAARWLIQGWSIEDIIPLLEVRMRKLLETAIPGGVSAAAQAYYLSIGYTLTRPSTDQPVGPPNHGGWP